MVRFIFALFSHRFRLNTKGEEIVGNWDTVEKVKYAIKTTPSSTILRINHLNIDDMGEYSLQATNHDRIEMLNFTLDVLGMCFRTTYSRKIQLKLSVKLTCFSKTCTDVKDGALLCA